MRHAAALLAFLSASLLATQASATSLTFGVGSAVTSIDAAANFENPASLFGNPYVEDGISFSRTLLSFNNNGCGYAGCLSSFPGFTGNYLYGVYHSGAPPTQPGVLRPVHGYFSIEATGGRLFSGLEFISDSGFGGGGGAIGFDDDTISWQTYRSGALVGGGLFHPTNSFPLVLGFSDPLGFDELIYTRWLDELDAPALDTLRAQYVVTAAVPEPDPLLLLGTGLALVVRHRRNPLCYAAP